LATYLQPPAGADVSIIRQDRGSSLVVMPLEILIDLLKS
jgi:hypothetical protein